MKDRVGVPDSVNSGQVFLWKRSGRRWFGINGTDVLEVGEDPDWGSVDGKTREFFRLDDAYGRILGDISRDPVVARCVKRYRGLRLLRQDPFQCYISFIVSSNSNIPNIKSRLEMLCSRFGGRARRGQETLRLFPGPRRLARARIPELRACGLGYRAGFVKGAAERVSEGRLELEPLKRAGYGEAKDRLLEVPGVGGKVADCIMLFSLERMDAFPMDTWILRVLERQYAGRFRIGGKTLTPKRYARLHEEAREHFGEYAGYAQQFLFKMARDQDRRKWL